MTKYACTLPVHILPAIFNDDDSGLTDKESTDVQIFLDEVQTDQGFGCWAWHPHDEPSFRAHNDYDTLAGECVEVLYITR